MTISKIVIKNSGGKIRLDNVSLNPVDFIVIRDYTHKNGMDISNYLLTMFESEAEYIRRHNKVTDIFKNAYNILETQSNGQEEEIHQEVDNPNL